MEKFFDFDRTYALLVLFKKPIFEDDFPEVGMKAWLTKIVKDKNSECYKLYFDFEEFFEYNKKYFTADYYDKNGTPCQTALENDMYPKNHKYSVYFGSTDKTIEENETDLRTYLKIIRRD